MKMNKKGFTLIEMLVVIAIIAVLVAIVIPTVTSATQKANAAANAANMRSLLAEASIDYLGGKNEETGMVKTTFSGADVTFTVTTAPVVKPIADLGITAESTYSITLNTTTKNIEVTLGGKTLAQVAEKAS